MELAARALLRIGSLALLGSSLALAGCGDDDDHLYRDRDGWAAPSSSAPPVASNGEPMLVEVETDKTMTATGGDGVGVFVEYGAGGAWRVSWTCDTNVTRQPCDFDIQIAGENTTLANVARDEFGTDSDITAAGADGKTPAATTQPLTSVVFAKTRTTNEVRTVTFDTLPGATVLVVAKLEGQPSDQGGFLFFVQDGKVNGGFGGRITNALYFRGTKP